MQYHRLRVIKVYVSAYSVLRLINEVVQMLKLSFENCTSLIECVNRYQYYLNVINEEDKPFLDWIFYSYVADNLEDDLWNAARGQ